MLNLVVNNTELLEQTVGTAASLATGSKLYLKNYPQTIRNVKTFAIIAHYVVDYSNASDGNAVVDATEVAAAFLVLSVGGTEVVKIPVYSLIPSLNGGLIRQFNDLNIDWDNSYVQINTPTPFENNDTFAFTVIYK